MVGPQRRPSADIIPIQTASRPRAGRGSAGARGTGTRGADSLAADTVRGTILLFTGVRYERLLDLAEPTSPAESTSPAEPTLPAPERRCRR